MNESEATRLVDLGRTEVVAVDPSGVEVARGVAVRLELVPTLTIERADGSKITAPVRQVNRVS